MAAGAREHTIVTYWRFDRELGCGVPDLRRVAGRPGQPVLTGEPHLADLARRKNHYPSSRPRHRGPISRGIMQAYLVCHAKLGDESCLTQIFWSRFGDSCHDIVEVPTRDARSRGSRSRRSPPIWASAVTEHHTREGTLPYRCRDRCKLRGWIPCPSRIRQRSVCTLSHSCGLETEHHRRYRIGQQRSAAALGTPGPDRPVCKCGRRVPSPS